MESFDKNYTQLNTRLGKLIEFSRRMSIIHDKNTKKINYNTMAIIGLGIFLIITMAYFYNMNKKVDVDVDVKLKTVPVDVIVEDFKPIKSDLPKNYVSNPVLSDKYIRKLPNNNEEYIEHFTDNNIKPSRP